MFIKTFLRVGLHSDRFGNGFSNLPKIKINPNPSAIEKTGSDYIG